MSDKTRQHDFDDELLSAYLDEELAPDERARVEAHLAADPAARQMLDELRHVSQVVRDLPRKPAPKNASEAIVRRAIDSQRLAERPVDLDKPTPLPTLSIGRTRRGWVWASVAVAAALLIMFIERGPKEQDANTVAMHREQPSLTATPSAAPEVELIHSPQAPQSSAVASREITAEGPAGSGSASVDRAAAPIETASDEQPLVVVHVLAKRKAIEDRAFDQLLVSNGIAIVLDANESQARASDTTGQNARDRLKSTADQPPAASQDVDVVLVDAPPKKIESFMADLNQDYSNYLGVSVDDPAPHDQAPAREVPANSKLAADLGRYNRGSASPQQTDQIARNRALFYHQVEGTAPQDLTTGAPQVAAGELKSTDQLPLSASEQSTQGSAQRLLLPKFDADSLSDLRKLGRVWKAPAVAHSKNLQVLFLLTPGDEPAASPAAESRAE